MKNFSQSVMAVLVLSFVAGAFSCSSSGSPEDKASRPQKIVKAWVLDTTAFRKEFDKYFQANWKEFEANVDDKDQIPQAELDSMRRYLKRSTEVAFQRYKKVYITFRADGTYENFSGTVDKGTYHFNKSLDSILMKTNGYQTERPLPVVALSDNQLQIAGKLAIPPTNNGPIQYLDVIYPFKPKQ